MSLLRPIVTANKFLCCSRGKLSQLSLAACSNSTIDQKRLLATTTTTTTTNTVIVTGSNSGIGKATATELARRGARVILACRNVDAAEQAANEIRKKIGATDSNNNHQLILVRQLDLTSFKSVRRFADDINKSALQIDVLINNAGILPPPKRQTTIDGYEITFQTNFLGHFLLTNLLLDNLRKSNRGGRVINAVADPRAFYLCWPPYGLQFLESAMLMKQSSSYNPLQAYVGSKLAIALATTALHQRLHQQQEDKANNTISTFAVDPGVIRPDLGRNTSPVFKSMLMVLPKFLFKTFEQGAETAVYCATQPRLQQFSGRFFQNRKPVAVASRATDSAAAARLWRLSEDVVKPFL